MVSRQENIDLEFAISMQTSSSVSGANVGIHNGVCESLLVSLSSVTPPLSSSSRSRVTFCKVPFKVVGKR